MFQLFGFGGARCSRCEHKNAAAAGYCAQCGLSLGTPGNDAVLHANQWRLADNQLALFFGVRELSSLFGAAARRLQVPEQARAWIVQSDAFTSIPFGDDDSAAFFACLPQLLQGAKVGQAELAHQKAERLQALRGEALVAQQAHVAELARIDIDCIDKIGTLSDTGKVAMAAAPNAAVLAQLLKTQLQTGMRAEQIHALAAAENSIAPLDAMRMAQDGVALQP